MSIRTFSGRDGALRIYDGSTPPHYVELKFISMNFSGPLARQRPVDPVVPTVGGFIHAPTGPDFDAGMYDPSPVSFSGWVNSVDWNTQRAAFSNIDLDEPWKVGSHTWTTTKGRGSIRVADGSFRPTAPFFDTLKKAVNIQTKWAHPSASGSIVAMSYDEVYFPPQSVTINESADFVEIRVNQVPVYGNIRPIGDFSDGTSSI
jgi:hypothetical protein